MDLAISIKRFLDQQATDFELIRHKKTATLTEAAKAIGIHPSEIARAVILKDTQGFLMAVLPADRLINFNHIEKQLGRNLEPAPIEDVLELMKDCEPGAIPPIGLPYELDVLIDNSIKAKPTIYIEPGSHTSLLKMPLESFGALHSGAAWTDMAYHDYELISQNTYDFVIPSDVDNGFKILDCNRDSAYFNAC